MMIFLTKTLLGHSRAVFPGICNPLFLCRQLGDKAYTDQATKVNGINHLDRTVDDWRYLVDWRLQRQRPFVVLDPNDPENLMYISERDYKDLQKVCLSNDFPLTVIARKGTVPPAGWDGTTDPTQNTPPRTGKPGRVRLPCGADVPFIRSGLWNHIRKQRSWIANLLKLSAKASMVDISKIPRGIFFLSVVWGRALMHYTKLGRPGFRLGLLSKLGSHLQDLVVNQGVTTTIARLKIYLFCLYSYLGGDPLSSTQALGSRIRLTHGLPTCFPLEVRQAIRSGSLPTIRWWASLLNMYKAISGPHTLKGSLDSVTAPPFMGDIGQFSEHVITLWERISSQLGYVPVYRPTTAYGRISMKSGPNGPFAWWRQGADALAWSLAPRNYLLELCALWRLDDFALKFTRAMDTANRFWDAAKHPPHTFALGSLALLREAAGKIRPVAMVDIWTQWILKPLHDWLLEMLRGLPTDATWDQEGVLKTFVERLGPDRKFYCYDLKNATDRIPMALYVEMFGPLLGKPVAELWARLLTDRWYETPDDAQEAGYPSRVRYTRGQPMGAYSSWASLAWVHHFLVQLAHLEVGGSGFFLDYLVLGDDLVIANEEVASKYLQLCEAFGITVGLAKSFTSVGLINFANKTYWKSVNVSPLSLKEELLAASWPARVSLASRVTDLWYAIGTEERTHTVLRNMVGPSVWTALQSELQAPTPHGVISALSLVALNPLALGRAKTLNTQVISDWLRTHVLKPVQTFGSLTPDFCVQLLLIFYDQLEHAQRGRLGLLRRWRQLVSIAWHESEVELMLDVDSIRVLMDHADSLKESSVKTKAYIDRITWGAGGLGWWAGGSPGRGSWARDMRGATPEHVLKFIEGILDHLIKINSELPCRVEHILTPHYCSGGPEAAQDLGRGVKGPQNNIIPHKAGVDYDGTKLGNLPWIAGPIQVPLYAPLFSNETLREGTPDTTHDAVSIPVARIEELCLRHFGESPLISALLGPSNQGKRAKSRLASALAAYTKANPEAQAPDPSQMDLDQMPAYGGPVLLDAMTHPSPAGDSVSSTSEDNSKDWLSVAADICARQAEINAKATRLAEWRSSLTTYRPGREIRMRSYKSTDF